MASSAAANGSSNATKVERPGMSLVVGMQNFNDSNSPTHFGSDDGPTITVPSLNNVMNSSDVSGGVQTKLIVTSSNPFQSTSKSQISGSILSLELADASGKELQINNTNEPFKLMIPAQQPARAFRASVDLFGITYFKVRTVNHIMENGYK